MAHTPLNTLTSDPIVLEIFSANINISTTPITVKAITFVSAAAGDDFALKTVDTEVDTGQIVVHMAQIIAGGMTVLNFGDTGHTFPSLYFDATEINAGLGAGDRVCIYLV